MWKFRYSGRNFPILLQYRDVESRQKEMEQGYDHNHASSAPQVQVKSWVLREQKGVQRLPYVKLTAVVQYDFDRIHSEIPQMSDKLTKWEHYHGAFIKNLNDRAHQALHSSNSDGHYRIFTLNKIWHGEK